MSRLNHYDCDLTHYNRKGEVSTLRHGPLCKTTPGHTGTTAKCPACRNEYVTAYFARPGNREAARVAATAKRGGPKRRVHEHYDCHLPELDHPVMKSVGRGHRAGCQVAEGHLAGVSASNECGTCRRAKERKTSRAKTLMTRHDMMIIEYDRLFVEQKGRCAICKRTQEDLRLAVDHSHQTGNRRGLLCRMCNLGLGNFRDNPSALRSAIRYLARSED